MNANSPSSAIAEDRLRKSANLRHLCKNETDPMVDAIEPVFVKSGGAKAFETPDSLCAAVFPRQLSKRDFTLLGGLRRRRRISAGLIFSSKRLAVKVAGYEGILAGSTGFSRKLRQIMSYAEFAARTLPPTFEGHHHEYSHTSPISPSGRRFEKTPRRSRTRTLSPEHPDGSPSGRRRGETPRRTPEENRPECQQEDSGVNHKEKNSTEIL